nr:MAG TPA: hypothetical protein [Caudoviricetes sp.]
MRQMPYSNHSETGQRWINKRTKCRRPVDGLLRRPA